jgi:hypothetical protein
MKPPRLIIPEEWGVCYDAAGWWRHDARTSQLFERREP